ncbi:MAG: hypothetical protein KatS3mg031_0999 [Chitinophagales bacterium]|nr:MAG: hypothetical protein KatS3mg031_0999 [Chitinophagales bacterium]
MFKSYNTSRGRLNLSMVKQVYFKVIVLLLPCFIGGCGKTVNCVDAGRRDLGRMCPPNYDPVCGCDDVTYTNACYAEREGLVSWVGGPCP